MARQRIPRDFAHNLQKERRQVRWRVRAPCGMDSEQS